MKKELKNKRGITLIALIVTIIVLLILAGVTIVTLTGENGLLARAATAREKNEEAENDEKEKIAGYEDEIDNWIRAGGTGGQTINVIGKIFGIDLVTEGEGTESSPFIITSKEQLYILAALVNSGESFEGKYIKLKNDIQLDSTTQWTPIGNVTTNFEGTFDGDGHTISGLYINNNLLNQGLFGVVGQNGTVKKFILEGSVTSSSRSAGLVGWNKGIIRNCINKATFSHFDSTNTGYGEGGICGNNSSSGIIYQCANLANITSMVNSGGIAGVNSGILKECYNSGNIQYKTGSGGGHGGICGNNAHGCVAYLYNCYNNSQSNMAGIAGIAGATGGSNGTSYIYNCYTVNNTTIVSNAVGSTENHINNYTTNSKDNIANLNSGIDEVGATTSTESPWIADGKKIDENGNVVDDLDENDNPILINGGYPILKWQK